ncbi:nicotinate phosphoribosyltransferase [Tulasnella sp. 403]|nr:nicotinate phosphoribosyltransferase [Tulasnella sp. 403]
MAFDSSSNHYVSSILDTDLYKLTMQQAVTHHFPDAEVVYYFTNRSKSMRFNQAAIEAITQAINQLENVQLTDQELVWLRKACPYFKSGYLDFLSRFRFKPKEQVTLRFTPSSDSPEWGDLDIDFKGKWSETILYETPVMAIVSEAYFKHVDTDWTLEKQEGRAYAKGKKLYEAGAILSEFGSRRRRSYMAQNLVIQGLLRADKDLRASGKGRLAGTSNVHFAHIYDLAPIGTIAHEWMMGVAATNGYEGANMLALKLWEQVYPPSPSNALHIALTDTFTSAVFFKDWVKNPETAIRWRGVRQDSGDPFIFIQQAKEAYESLGVERQDKLIIFSDGLDVDLAIRIKAACDEAGFKCMSSASFGIGTFMTNDFDSTLKGGRSKPMNIVIKLGTINGNPCIKISDDITKNTGDKDVVRTVKEHFGIPTS